MLLPGSSTSSSLVQAHLFSTTVLAAIPKDSTRQFLTASASAGSASILSSVFVPNIRTTSTTRTSILLFAQSNGIGRSDDDDSDNNNNSDNNYEPAIHNHSSSEEEGIPTTTAATIYRKIRMMMSLPPRATPCILMSIAMSLHFGGYEFARSGALALFTSSDTGFAHPSAYPFAIGLVTPVSLMLLYWYGLVLKADGPRTALGRTTGGAVAVLTVCTSLGWIVSSTLARTSSGSIQQVLLPYLSKLVVAILFVFQNSYAHLIYTQQWSFLGSVMTPTEGTRWFSAVAGLSSLVCTVTATMVHTLAERIGLFGLIFGTCVTLFGSMLLADEAYRLSETHGFDPTPDMQTKTKSKNAADAVTASTNNNNNKVGHNITGGDDKSQKMVTQNRDESLLSKTKRLFRTSPTLAGLFAEVVTFQSLSTVLNVCFVRQLKLSIPIDTDRASFTGRFYALVNGSSGLLQFLVLPLARRYLEPKWVYRSLPLLLMPLLLYTAMVVSSIPAVIGTTTTTGVAAAAATVASAHSRGLWIAALAFFALKSLDYSIRNVANEMVFQPLDFDARYLGKEVIGVFANRFGKSGSSMILSALASVFPSTWGKGTQALAQLSVGVGGIWSVCSVWLSSHVVTNKQAEEQVQERRRMTQQRTGAERLREDVAGAVTEGKKAD